MTNLNVFEGKHVFVIGGGSGIGLAAATLATNLGASVTLGGNDRQQLEAAARSLPGARTADIDISVRKSVEAAFAGMLTVDHLVITAGRRISGKLADNDPDYLLEAVQERVRGSVYAIRAALPILAKDASIVLTSGLLAQRPLAPGNAVFAASVGAIEAMVRGLALELQPVRVNAVAPGVTDSPLFAHVDPKVRSALFEKVAASSPVKRVGTVNDIASAIVFLMSNGYVSGEILRIDGGARVV